MKAWVVRKQGNPWEVFELADFDEPTHEVMKGYGLGLAGLVEVSEGVEPCRDYVIMRVSAAALATPDITMATGEYPIPIERPYVSGQEAVGIVEEASPSMTPLLGKRVMAFTPQPFGSFAPRCVGTAPTVWECPEQFSDAEAAGFFIPAHTAYHAVHRRGKVQRGETVLVLGAAGGVPSAAVQLCVAAGCRVIAVAGGQEKVAFCRGLGADAVIDHRAEDFVAAVRRETNGRGVDVIVDFVQGETGARARPLLAVEGRHLMCGHAGGLQPVHPMEFYVQNYTLVGVCMGSGYGASLPEIEQKAHDDLMALVEQGRYRSLVSRTISFTELPGALRDLAERRTMGRVVVDRGF